MININFVINTLLTSKEIFLLSLLLAISLVADNENPYSITNKHTTPNVLARPKSPIPSIDIVLARNGSIINDKK